MFYLFTFWFGEWKYLGSCDTEKQAISNIECAKESGRILEYLAW